MRRQWFYKNFKSNSGNINSKAFTLIELMVVFVVVALIAGFAIPTYDRAIRRSIERDAVVGLQAIRGALKIYKARYGSFPNVNLATYTDINTTLGINIVPNRVDYIYTYNAGISSIEADAGDWIISLNDLASTDPIGCTVAGTCPTCAVVASGGCNYGE